VPKRDELNERLLVLLPTTRDSERAVAAFSALDIPCCTCPDLAKLCEEIAKGAGAALLNEEAIVRDQSGCLLEILRSQPTWSDFPLIVLVHENRKHIWWPETELPVNVLLVDRPLRMATLKSVVNTALRHRRRQYQLRDALEQLKRSNQELEQKVNQRTARLQATIAELETFSYSVSHDLRTPLRAMQGYAEALLEDESKALSEEGKEYLLRIQRAAARLDQLVQDVLAYSKVSKSDTKLQPVDVGALMDEVLHSYPELAEKATITIKTPLPVVLAHESYLAQCISNILGNAIKFVAPEVRPKIDIGAESQRENARIFFSDNGIGIAPEHRARIFELFGRVHPDNAFPGTGIGLTIVKKAIERMGGSVDLESEPGRGSCFWLTLRRA